VDPVKHVYKEEAAELDDGLVPEITAAVNSVMQLPDKSVAHLIIDASHCAMTQFINSGERLAPPPTGRNADVLSTSPTAHTASI
jgi:hypothetical protein